MLCSEGFFVLDGFREVMEPDARCMYYYSKEDALLSVCVNAVCDDLAKLFIDNYEKQITSIVRGYLEHISTFCDMAHTERANRYFSTMYDVALEFLTNIQDDVYSDQWMD